MMEKKVGSHYQAGYLDKPKKKKKHVIISVLNG